jgi:hypothetical protein
MRRRTFDALMVAVGAALAIILLVAGGLMMWGSTYTHNNVRNQLAAQQIYFPAKGSSDLASPKIGPYLNQYAGQQLLTGQQAQAYADHFIAVHVAEMSGGKTYSQLSAQSLANPSNTKLATLTNTVFKGETLRGLLLNAYAFWKMSQLMLIGAIVAFAGAALLLILSVLGVVHLRRTLPGTEVMPALARTEPVPAP